jgi:phosphoribosylformimino-5-aminoimidazole carboxamide ribonucleotide (ProFAR) isomerase
MQVYPAIDVRGGRVARSSGTGSPVGFPTDPLDVAEQLVARGARWLHLVDLDRVFGSGDNDALMRRIARLAGVRVQIGGLLASADDVTRAFALGASRAVLSTAALADSAVVNAIVAHSPPDRLAASVDVRLGRAARRDASSPLSISPPELVTRAVAAGIAVIVYRDLERDGTLAGPDLDGATQLNGLGAEIIVAGGIASQAHLLAARDAGLGGAIVGRALLEGKITMEEALACSS